MTSLKTRIETPLEIYFDSLHENSRNQRDMSKVLNDQDIEIDNVKSTNIDSTPIIRNQLLNKEISKKT